MSTPNLDEIEDDDTLYKLLNETESFDDRKKIRARIRELRDKRTAEFERQKAERNAKPLEDAVTMRQRQAAAAKARKMQRYADEAKDGKKDVGTAEAALKERRARADAEKQAKIKQITEVGTALTSVAHEGTAMVQRAEEAAAKKKAEKHENEDSSYSSTKTDGSTTTSTSTTRSTTKGNAGPRGAMAAFKQMDPAPAGGAKPNFLAPGGRGGGGGGGGRGVAVQRSPSAIKQMLLDWCKAMTKEYENVNITNFSSSWNDGMAFCALIHHFHPEAFDFNKLNPKNRRGNFQLAFDVAEKYADIAPLLEAEDMVKFKNPDWKCVFCYIQSFYRKFRTAEVNGQQQQQAAE